MLQRAASNAYSWWWASHVRTKQSKWLEQNLQDMEDKVQHVVKLIEEDGDSFARRAEMYYKKRPELLNFVEESYRAYRALAERYDHISTELQNANNTIANLCPDQIALMEDDDEYSPKIPRNSPQVPVANSASVPKVPKVPKASIRDWKGLITASKHMGKAKKEAKRNNTKTEVPKSGLNKTEAFEEIDQLQKDILALQTVKEFVKSSYESGLSKYWGIENQISEMQERIFSLEDEFGTGKVIEDDEARRLMAETAMKSCKETLDHLQEKQGKYNQEATEEHKKINVARQKLKSIKREFLHDQADEEVESAKAEESQLSNGEPDYVMKEKQEMKVIQEKVRVHFEVDPLASLTVSELAEKIDELVNKVISLETSLSSQTVLIGRLRTEADDLHAQIQTLEEDKATIADDAKNLSCRLKNLEEKLYDIQDLDRNVEMQNSTLQTHFDEARSRLDHLSEKLNGMKSDEEPEDSSSFTNEKRKNEVGKNVEEQEKPTHANGKEEGSAPGREDVVKDEKEHDSGVASIDNQGKDIKPAEKLNGVKSDEEPEDSCLFTDEERNNEVVKNVEEQEKLTHANGKEGNTPGRDVVRGEKEHDSGVASIDNQGVDIKPAEKKKVIFQDPISKDFIAKQKPKSPGDDGLLKKDSSNAETDTESEHEWQQMLLNGLEDKEKILLSEYTKILRNYKEVKKKLSDMEKKEKDQEFDVALQISDLRSAIAKRDGEIKQLRQRLNLDEDSNTKEAHQASSDDHTAKSEHTVIHLIKKEDEEIKLKFVHQTQVMSQVEEQLRMDIDAILDENLEFWLRFSTSFHQIQKFKTTVHDLQNDISKIQEKKRQEGSNSGDTKSDARPLYKHLKEIQAELKVWLEQSVLIKDELERRFSSLCNIQEKITAALKAGVEEEEIIFSSHHAAKFQGEILNMKQENNKVREELQAGVDHVTSLQEEIDKSLQNLDEEFGLNGDQPQLRHSGSRARVPLRSFIFGTKVKKQKYSIFSCVHPNKKYQVLRSGLRF